MGELLFQYARETGRPSVIEAEPPSAVTRSMSATPRMVLYWHEADAAASATVSARTLQWGGWDALGDASHRVEKLLLGDHHPTASNLATFQSGIYGVVTGVQVKRPVESLLDAMIMTKSSLQAGRRVGAPLRRAKAAKAR